MASRLEGFALTWDEAESRTIFALEPAPRAEYAFSVLISDAGEPTLMAQLVAEPSLHAFWLKPFEATHPSAFDHRDQVFLDVLDQCLGSPTRITQRKGLLFWRFSCSYLDDEVWQSLGSTSVGRRMKGVPPIASKVREYHSARLLRAA